MVAVRFNSSHVMFHTRAPPNRRPRIRGSDRKVKWTLSYFPNEHTTVTNVNSSRLNTRVQFKFWGWVLELLIMKGVFVYILPLS